MRLQKCTRAHLSIKQSEQVVYSKIAPTLAYTCMVARPTQAQTHKLRTAIFKACAGRHFATQDAQALLLHKTHLFEPIAIMVYFSLCAWRRAFNIPGMAQQVSSLISEPSRRRMQGKGPITLLNEDLKWIGCSFDANTGALQHDGIGATCTFYETNKGFFSISSGSVSDTGSARILMRNMSAGRESKKLILNKPLLCIGKCCLVKMAVLRLRDS